MNKIYDTKMEEQAKVICQYNWYNFKRFESILTDTIERNVWSRLLGPNMKRNQIQYV